MDDAQQIVVVALQQAGIQVPDGVRAGNELNSTALVAICAQAINSLHGAPALPTSLPAGTTERFRACTDLAGAVKLLGYRGDLSFHQFLYPSHKDTHKLLRFFLEKLSKSSSSSSSTSTQSGRGRKSRTGASGSGGASTRMSGVVREALTRAHGDSHTAEVSVDNVIDLLRFQTCVLRTSVVKTVENVRQVKPTLVTLKAKLRQTVLPSLLELNAKNAIRARSEGANLEVEGHVRASLGESGDVILMTHGEFLPHQLATGVSNQLHFFDGSNPRANDGDDVEVERDGKAVVLLQEQVKELMLQGDRMETETRTMEDRISVQKEEYEAKVGEIRLVEDEMTVLRDAVSLVLNSSKSSPSDALQELQEEVVQGKQHMDALQAEWEAVRRSLEEKKAELEKDIITGEGEIASKTSKLEEIRQQLQQCTEKLRVREEQAWTLETDLKEISSRPKRSSYVHRITELVKNSQKQETDIAKIIADTRALQRDRNATNDRLRRTYALVDELVFRDAKKDLVCRQAYRHLTTIHETFADVVDNVLEMDKTGRDIAELQAQLEELQKSSLDVQSVQADIDAVAIETRILERRLALVQASTHRNILIQPDIII